MRLLIFTPTYDDASGASGLRPETVASIVGQQTAHRLTWEIGRRNPYPGRDMRNVLAQYNMAREMCLSGPYDGLVTVEHDMIVPHFAVQALSDTPAPVVYASYALRPHGVMNTWQYVGTAGLGMSLERYPAEWLAYKEAGVGRVSGVGFGCTLIRREVVEAIPFRQDLFEHAPDMPFAEDCVRAGILQLARFDVRCGHIHKGEILTVEREIPEVKVTVLQSVNILKDGGGVALHEGETVELAPEQAQELATLGYVRLGAGTEEAPAERTPRRAVPKPV